jgi:proteasome lid subunit RPN8/RPN11
VSDVDPSATRLALSALCAAAIAGHARAAYPHECCGFLVGPPVASPQAARIVSELVPTTNTRDDSPHNRYLIGPAEFVRVQREADRRGLDIIGFYHSHPDAPARPSAFDRAHAWAGYAYLIIRVEHGAPRELLGWTLPAGAEANVPFAPLILEETGP